jgi:hypothetical protein
VQIEEQLLPCSSFIVTAVAEKPEGVDGEFGTSRQPAQTENRLS